MSVAGKSVGRLVSAVFFFAAVCLCARPAQAGKQYTFLIPIAEGFSFGAMQNILKDVGKIVTAKIGIPVQAKERIFKHGFELNKMVLDDFKSGKGDFAYIYSQDYLRFPEVKAAVVPMFTFTVNNKTSSLVCAYTRASDGIKSPQQLKGKKWGMNVLLPTYWWLFKNGLKDEPKKFFGDMKYMEDNPVTDILDKLLANKIDVFVVTNPTVDMAMNADAKYGKGVARVGCVEYDHNHVFVAGKEVSPGEVDKMSAAFLGAHKDKQFQRFWFVLKAIKGHFVPLEEKNLAGTKELVKQAQKAGWYDKEKAFLKTKTVN